MLIRVSSKKTTIFSVIEKQELNRGLIRDFINITSIKTFFFSRLITNLSVVEMIKLNIKCDFYELVREYLETQVKITVFKKNINIKICIFSRT